MLGILRKYMSSISLDFKLVNHHNRIICYNYRDTELYVYFLSSNSLKRRKITFLSSLKWKIIKMTVLSTFSQIHIYNTMWLLTALCFVCGHFCWNVQSLERRNYTCFWSTYTCYSSLWGLPSPLILTRVQYTLTSLFSQYFHYKFDP